MLAVSASLVLRCVLRGGEDWASVYQVPRPHSIGCLPPCSLPPTARHYRFLLLASKTTARQRFVSFGPIFFGLSQGCRFIQSTASARIPNYGEWDCLSTSGGLDTHCETGLCCTIKTSTWRSGKHYHFQCAVVYDSIRSVTLQWRLQHRQAVSRCMEQRRRRISRVASARPYF